jgi:hypothetical protein
MELDKNVKHGYLPFTEKEILNIFLKANKKIERSDVKDLLKIVRMQKTLALNFNIVIHLMKKEG